MKKKKWVIFGAVLLFLAAAGLGIYFGTPAIPREKTEREVPVQSVAGLTGYAEEMAARTRFLGVLMPQEAVEVRLDEGRQINGLLVEAGSRVEAGAALASYDNSGLELDAQQAALDIEQAKLTLSQLKGQLSSLRQSKKDAPEHEKGSYDLQILDMEGQLRQAEYDLEQRERELLRITEMLGETMVSSPCAGIVTAVSEDGRSITIVSEGTYELSFFVSEEELEDFHAGMEVNVSDRNGETSLTAAVSRTESGSPGKNVTDGGAMRPSSYEIHCVLEEAEGFFAGQHVYVEVPEEEETEGEEEIVLPQGYILDVDGDPWVWAAGDGGTLEKRSVSLGAYNDRKSAYVVETGLSMTDYLAWPMDSLKEGQKVSFGEQEVGG